MPAPLETSAPTGLSQTEAEARLAREGFNELADAGHHSLWRTIWGVVKEPMLLLLLAAGFIYLLLGDVHDALVLIAFAGLSIVITIVQEERTGRAIEALRDYSMPHALVIRDGVRRQVPARELVRGDLLLVAEGDRIAADGWVIDHDGLQADEAILTGESVPVRKTALTSAPPADTAPAEPPLPGGDDLPYLYSGTLVVRGTGMVRIAATGPRSQIGQIGASLAGVDVEAPRLTQQTGRLVRWFALLGGGISLLAVLLYGTLRGGWLDALLAGIALGMSMLPEEFPVVLAVFMAMGALRMSRARVLTRRGAAIETLGAATVLCTDKTGTLTQNRMEIAELRLPDGRSFGPQPEQMTEQMTEQGPEQGLVLPDAFVELAGLGILACMEEPFDPMETAFHALGERHQGDSLSWRQDAGWTLRHHYALAPELLAMSHVWGSADGGDHLVATKGAPEAIADLCHMAAPERQAMKAAVAEMAARGLRVLGVAEAAWANDAALPDHQHQFTFAFRGLVGLADPIRASVPDAVAQLQQAGIRIVMITGDYPDTARAIAAQAGIAPGGVMSGPELAALDDAALAAQVHDIAVFARVMPDQKLRIVQALKACGEIVAMTGDGVNDAPSLKAAHIGIAMGERGTDVAREASAIVLLDDDFGTIATAVRLGRRIYDNLRKAMGFIVAVHLPIGGLALAPLLTSWPIILGPLHIALLEMVIDPVCSLAFEAETEEDDIMARPPRAPDSPLFSRILVGWSAVQGIVTLVALIALLLWARAAGMETGELRSVVFAGLVAAVVVLVFVNRAFGRTRLPSRSHFNLPLALILLIVSGMMALLFGTPFVAELFRFTLIPLPGLGAILVMALALFWLLHFAKRRFHRALAG